MTHSYNPTTSGAVPPLPVDNGVSDRNGARIIGARGHSNGPGPSLMLADTLTGNDVVNLAGDTVGDITGIMLDVQSGRVAYAVLSVGGFLGIGNRLFAIPWGALTLDVDDKNFILDISKERLAQAPGFDKDNWPTMADTQWATQVHSFYHAHPYWD